MAEKKNPYEKPIRLETNLYWNQAWYIIADPQQREYRLIGLTMDPPRQLKFKLRESGTGDIMRVFDFECSLERDEAKFLKWKDQNYGDTDGNEGDV